MTWNENQVVVNIIPVSGAEYGFSLKCNTGAPRHDYNLSVDGQLVNPSISTVWPQTVEHVCTRSKSGKETIQKLKFGEIKTSP